MEDEDEREPQAEDVELVRLDAEARDDDGQLDARLVHVDPRAPHDLDEAPEDDGDTEGRDEKDHR